MKASELTFLVVDDFSTMRRIMVGLLRAAGYPKTVVAEDGVQALHVLENSAVGFIISDWNMPNMTGLEFLKAVRAHKTKNATPFLLATAEARKENILEAVQARADGYVVKPFSAITLQEKLTQILVKHGIEP